MANTKMQWEKLICDKRLGMESYHDNHEHTRSDFQRDYDRMVFSAPFRRLQNKTQVFPLPGSIFVHNRLTHSLEVSCAGRSLANNVSKVLTKKHASQPWVHSLYNIDEIIAAACLAHDLGNPPFGHSGERAIASYFSEGNGLKLKDMFTLQQWSDFVNYEGNANAFRLLTHQFNGRRPGGFAMTYSTLASIVKYPYASSHNVNARGKSGWFTSEQPAFQRVADELGMIKVADSPLCYKRHPFVYLVEAADDICYQVMDIEDAHKMKILTAEQVQELFLPYFEEEKQAHMRNVMAQLPDKNEQVAYMRSSVIGTLVDECSIAFINNEDKILSGEFEGELIDHVVPRVAEAYAKCSATAWNKIYNSSDVLDIELAGNKIITELLDILIPAVMYPEKNYSRILLNKIPSQYETRNPELYCRIMAILDYISGMTDGYAMELYRKINGMSIPVL